MTIKRTWVVENKWTCDSCNTENLGRHMACQKCGSPKEKQEKDVVPDPDAAPAVTDPELLRLANQGANWVCEYCGGQVRNEFGKCVKNCGAPRIDPVLTKMAAEAAKAETEAGVVLEASRPSGKPLSQPRPLPTGVPGPGVPRPDWSARSDRRAPKKKVPWLPIGIVSGVAALAALLVWLLTPWEEDAKVNFIEWRYTSDLRQKTLMHGEGWGSPIGSFNVSCRSKYYGDEDCHPHQCNPHSVSYDCNCTSYECNCRKSCSDNKNGFSTCSESCSTCQRCSTCSRTEYDTCYDRCPVYRDYCTYDYYEWPIIQTLKTSGMEHNEHWPELAANGPEQRLDRAEFYEVTFIEAHTAKDHWTYRPGGLTAFKTFEPGQFWRIQVNRIGSVTPLQRKTK